MSTRLELRQLVRDVAVAYPADANDALIDRFMLEGYRKVINRQHWNWLLKTSLVSGLPGTGWPYPFASLGQNVIDIVDIHEGGDPIEVGPALQRTDHNHLTTFERPNQSGKPRYYYVENTDIWFFPAGEEAASYVFKFYDDPGWAVGDSEIPIIPEFAQESTIVNFALHRLWERMEDFDRSDAYLARFELGIADLVYADNVRGESDRPKVYGEKVAVGGKRNHMPWIDGV